MKYLILSDLHLGGGDNADDFKGKDDALIKLLISENPDVIILNGDILELWETTMRRIKKQHTRLLNFLKYKKAIYVRGNHDFAYSKPDKYVIEDYNICITHGFQNDKWMTSSISRLGCWLLSLIERLIPNVDAYLAKNQLGDRASENALKYAKKLLEKYDKVILGHTHQFGEIIEGKYYNSGSGTSDMIQYIVIDQGEITLRTYKAIK